MKTLRLTALLFLLASVVSPATAQPLWVGTTDEAAVALEILRPAFEEGEGLSFLTTTVFLSARVPVSNGIRFVGELPLAHYGYSDPSSAFSASDTGVGNPYLGVEFATATPGFTGEAGVRLPLAREGSEALLVGALAEFDRFEAFTPDYASVLLGWNYAHTNADGLRLHLRVAPSVSIYTGRQAARVWAMYPNEMELMLAYGSHLRYAIGLAELSGGVTGRMHLTGEGDTGNRTTHHLGLGASLNLGRVHPGLLLRLPIDEEMGSVLEYVVGLSLAVGL